MYLETALFLESNQNCATVKPNRLFSPSSLELKRSWIPGGQE